MKALGFKKIVSFILGAFVAVVLTSATVMAAPPEVETEVNDWLTNNPSAFGNFMINAAASPTGWYWKIYLTVTQDANGDVNLEYTWEYAHVGGDDKEAW